MSTTGPGRDTYTQPKLLATLERLLAIQATALEPALEEASDLIASAVGAEKADTFLHDPATQTLIAVGTSATPMGRHQRELGLDRLPTANGGRAVEVFQTGRIHLNGHVETDAGEVRGIREALGVRSSLIVPLDVAGMRRGAVMVSSARPEAFSAEDRLFMEAVAGWVGSVIQRAELVERLTREAGEEARRLAAEEIVTVLAHDLGNYLTPLMSRTYLLRGRAEREGRLHDVTEANALERGLQRLQRFVAGLLDVARLDEGMFAVSLQPVNVTALAHDVAGTVQTPQFHVRVRAAGEIMATADPERLRQALENLIANAHRHAPGSPVVLEVRREQRGGDEVAVLTVQDQGPGIAPELLPRLMERFVRGKGTQGLGIGLYLARRIAEAHGGTLEVTSVPGEGTSFHLVVPAAFA